MQTRKIEELTDLELAEASGEVYSQLLQIQQSLAIINQEIQKRKTLKEKEKK